MHSLNAEGFGIDQRCATREHFRILLIWSGLGSQLHLVFRPAPSASRFSGISGLS